MAQTQIKSSIKKKKKKLDIYSVFTLLLYFALVVIEIFFNGSYLDEVIGVLAAVYLLFFRSRMERRDVYTVIILAAVVLYGLLSNTISSITVSNFSMLVDAVSETKLILAFFGVKYLLNDREKQSVIDWLTMFAIIFTVAAFFCGIISLFVDIGMSGSERYGVPAFRFIFNHEHQYNAVYMLVFGVLVCSTRIGKRTRILLYVMALISMMLSTKAPSFMFALLFVGLAYYFKGHEKLSPAAVIFGIIIIVIVGQYQIQTYLINEDAPRHIFFQYAIKTANDYFPFGSGFATYGSDQAARNYSELYYQYGFNELNGMNPDNPAFLSDTFWPMAIGQFGWIGSIAYIYVYVRIFLTFRNKKFSNERKAFLYAGFLQYMIHAIGSAILSSSAGMIGFMGLAMVTEIDEEQEKSGERLKVHF